MTTIRRTTASSRIACAAAAACLLGCASSGGASGETHFVCAATPDCAVHGAGYTCVHGICRSHDGGAGATADGSMTSRPMGGGGVVASSTGDGATGMPASGGTAGSAAGSTGNHAASGAGGADAGTADAGAGGSGGGAGSGSGGGGRTTDRDAATDAPTRSARGAITFQIGPTPGFVCQHTNGRLSFPFADRGGVEAGLLACDSTTGCKPDEFVFEDGAPDITFGCSVVPNGGNFLVYVNLHVDGSPNMVFGATGILSPSGGTLSINEANSLARGGGTDSACSLQLPPHMSFLESGRIWARFTCTQFRDPNDLSDTGCTVDGAFLFEGCGG